MALASRMRGSLRSWHVACGRTQTIQSRDSLASQPNGPDRSDLPTRCLAASFFFRLNTHAQLATFYGQLASFFFFLRAILENNCALYFLSCAKKKWCLTHHRQCATIQGGAPKKEKAVHADTRQCSTEKKAVHAHPTSASQKERQCTTVLRQCTAKEKAVHAYPGSAP